MAEVEYQKNCRRCRQRADEQCSHDRQVGLREEAEADKDDRDPAHQHDQERYRNGDSGLCKEKPRLRQLDPELNCLGLHLAFGIVPGRQRQQLVIEQIGLSAGLKRCRRGACGRVRSSPDAIDQRLEPAPQQDTNGLRFGPRPCEDVVEQNDVRGDLFDLVALRLIRRLRGSDQKAEDERRKRGDQSGTQPHHILGIRAQVRLRQNEPKQHAQQRAPENARKGDF